MAKSKSYGGLIVLLLVLGGAGAGGWYYFRKGADKGPEFTTVKVTRGDITQSVTATGDLQPVVTVDIGAQVSGQIKEVLVDFNSKVKAGDVLARIDEATPTQRLNQAKADLESTKANNLLIETNLKRTRELFEKNLVSQSELDSSVAQKAQSDATMLTRQAAVANAELDLSRTVITAPIDGMVLDRKTDKGRTVNASMNAPTLFTLVNDLSRMQINAAVAEADVGMIAEGQTVRFTVDAFPNQNFTGTVRQVRSAATANQSVVSYATIIDVNNENMRLKPGMTANVSIIVTEKRDVLRVSNSALRVRIPQEMLPAAPTATVAKGGDGKGGDAKNGDAKSAAAAMSPDERRAAMTAIMRDAGIQQGTPPTPEAIEKAKKLATEKGIDPDQITRMVAFMSGGGRGGPGGGGGGRGGRGGGGGGGSSGGFTTQITNRTVYKLEDPAALEKKVVAVTARLGVSDGIFTEVLEGLADGEAVITGVTLPGQAPIMQGPQGANPFSGSRGGMGGMGGSSGGGGMRRGG